MSESHVVTAVGVSVNSRNQNLSMRKLIEKTMADEVLRCTQEGISTEEKNSEIIRQRMLDAKERVLAEHGLGRG